MIAQALPTPEGPWEWVLSGGALGVLSLLSWLLVSGRLVPRGAVLEERAQHALEIKARDDVIERLTAERNTYIDLALRTVRTTERTTDALIADQGATLERIAQDAARAAAQTAAEAAAKAAAEAAAREVLRREQGG